MGWLFAITAFTSAFLGFSLQPMMARMILPCFGGAPAVWNTAMVFFQATLLVGYAYAHAATKFLGGRRAAVLHSVLVLLVLVCLPIVVHQAWTAPSGASPVLSVLGCLLLSAGLPFFVVSAGTPLLQHCFTTSGLARTNDPYRLYSASNAGSLLGLLSYPAVIEPTLRLGQQTWLWTAIYGVLVVLIGACAVAVWRARAGNAPVPEPTDGECAEDPAPQAGLAARFRWVLMAFVPSSLLLGVTTHLSIDICPMPLLWVVPLSLYLLTFIIAFDRPREWLQRSLVWSLPIFIVLPLATFFIPPEWQRGLILEVGVHLLCFTAIALAFHGELAKRRPAAAASTEFYMWVALGGVLGGGFNALLAPVIFSTLLEYKLMLVVAGLTMPAWELIWPMFGTRRWEIAAIAVVSLLTVWLWWQFPNSYWKYSIPIMTCALTLSRPLIFGLGIGTILCTAQSLHVGKGQDERYRVRSFFGTMSVVGDAKNHYRLLYHGQTLHGAQWLDPGHRHIPVTYYDPTGPIGCVFGNLRAFAPRRKLEPVAVIGLGTGSLAAYGGPGEEFTFFEIDPEMEKIARKDFTFLQDSSATCDIVLGDGRLSMMREPDHKYRLIVLDAFSSDAIPTHLLTCEAMALYEDKLLEGGIIAIHISNRYLDLEPVLFAIAEARDLQIRAWEDDFLDAAANDRGKSPSKWVILARHENDFKFMAVDMHWHMICRKKVRAWTDDYCNVLGALHLQW